MNELSDKVNEEVIKDSGRLWNKNFFILWQGQFISAFGDAIYEIGLGFWILAKTGSTALMSLIMTSMLIPKILTGMVAGVWIDKLNRKKIIVFLELMRGVIITSLGIATVMGYEKLWMFPICGIILGICSAIFNPTINTILPDIVPKKLLIKANSTYEIACYSTMLIGNISGGIIYSVIGAPLMFLINGVSFIISGVLEAFMKVPKIFKQNERVDFKDDFQKGLKFLWKYKGLKYILIIFCLSNFFIQMGYILLMPLFKEEPNLGVVRYGFCMGTMMTGMIVGVFLLAQVNIKVNQRYFVFISSGIISMISAAMAPIIINFYVACICLFLFGVFNSISNILFRSTIQLVVPQTVRGKIFSIISTLTGILTPLGMVVGGLLSTVFGIRHIMIFSFGSSLLSLGGLVLFKEVKELFNTKECNIKGEETMQIGMN